jgi:CheY-like chemotaxis protein
MVSNDSRFRFTHPAISGVLLAPRRFRIAVMPLEILLIEDNPSDLRLIEQITGYSTVPVKLNIRRNCAGAVAILDEAEVVLDLVIADMRLLEFGGVELLKRCNPRGIPVVVFSGSMNPSDEEQALSLGAKEFVRKPIQLDDYVEAVWKMIWKWAKPESASAGTI